MKSAAASAALTARIEKIVAQTPVTDVHTHLYDPAFGELLLWGIDDLLTYHYLVAEAFRHLDISYEKFWSLGKTGQADLIWNALFIEHSPISEACRGVLTTLNLLGLDVKKRDLAKIRKWFAGRQVGAYTTQCMKLANVERIFMTNSPFDSLERRVWKKGFERDDRFVSGLRIDPVLLAWPETSSQLSEWKYSVSAEVSPATLGEIRRFLADWTRRIDAKYLMVSLPPEFQFPEPSVGNRILEGAVLPHCREFNLPLALMPGVRRAVNPQLKLAGDGSGLSSMRALANLCAHYPENKFLATVLPRENQHELCVVARKFRNLHIFGCWWFTNIPYLVDEMTRLRVEMLGTSVTLQHSDARVLDQLIYKWTHSKKIIARVLAEKYADLAATGWVVTEADLRRDIQDLLGGAFQKFLKA